MQSKFIRALIGPLAMIVLALAPQAQARESAKFKVLSLSGTTTGREDVVYKPSAYPPCAYSQTESISFHSTKRITAYAFTSKAHGSARVEWSTEPTFAGNLTVVQVPGEVTVSRSATYQQGVAIDEETGETYYGCYHETSLDGSPAADCTVKKTLPATLNIGGTSDLERTTYIDVELSPHDENELDHACEVGIYKGDGDPRLFSRADLFNRHLKRVRDTDRVQTPNDSANDEVTVTGTSVQELAGELKRKKLPSPR